MAQSKPITLNIHVNLTGLQGLLAQAYAQAGALQTTLTKINTYQLVVTSDSVKERIDSVELAKRANQVQRGDK